MVQLCYMGRHTCTPYPLCSLRSGGLRVSVLHSFGVHAPCLCGRLSRCCDAKLMVLTGVDVLLNVGLAVLRCKGDTGWLWLLIG